MTDVGIQIYVIRQVSCIILICEVALWNPLAVIIVRVSRASPSFLNYGGGH